MVVPGGIDTAIRDGMDPLLDSLCTELMQEETSARVHLQREADRLVGTPLAPILLATSAHAELSLSRVPLAMRAPKRNLGAAVGLAFSNVREFIADRFLTREQSYRGSLLGMRHGIDLVDLMLTVSRALGETEIAEWCAEWLPERRQLVERASAEMAWFAAHRESAMEDATQTAPVAPGP